MKKQIVCMVAVVFGFVALMIIGACIWTESVLEQGRQMRTASEQPRQEISYDHQVVMIALSHAESWPRITREESAGVRALLKEDANKAIKLLKQVVDNAVTKRMIEAGYDPTKHRWSWYQNNNSTTVLWIYYPLAKKLGKEADMIAHYKGGYDWRITSNDPDEWNRQRAWHVYGTWPWAGETPPEL